MYNRYIPQSDGSFQRNRMEDKSPDRKPKPPCHPIPPVPEPCIPKNEPPSCACPHNHHPPCANHQKHHQQTDMQRTSVSSFLKQLLPKDFDTTDLMIVLLLLIMSGDCTDDQNTALLTLVLYLFL